MSEVVTIQLNKLGYHENQTEKRNRQSPQLRTPEGREKLRATDPQLVAVYESFAEKGQLNPCIVLPRGKGYYMWCGNQRLCAAIALGWESMQCVVVESWEQVSKAVTENYKTDIYWHPEMNRWHTCSFAFSPIPVEKLRYNTDEGEDYWGGFVEKLKDPEWRKANEDMELVHVYRSLRDQGQLNPVILKESFRVAIGMERLTCARALGWETMLCYRWPPSISDVRDVMKKVSDRRFVWNGRELVKE